jgi:hypothetical protein
LRTTFFGFLICQLTTYLFACCQLFTAYFYFGLMRMGAARFLLIPWKNIQKKQIYSPLSLSSAGDVASWVGGAAPS